MTNNVPTREQFKEYVDIRDRGVTNNITTISKTELTKDICIYIMGHFLELANMYNIRI